MALPVNVDVTWVDAVAVQLTAGELRRADSASFAGSGAGDSLGVGGGVVRHSGSSLSVAVDSADVITIQPGAVVIPGNAVFGTGCYRTALPSVATGSLAARNSTNPRIDRVIFRALDTDVVSGHGAYAGRVEVLTGTPSATPAAPSLPTMAVELARVTVPQTNGGNASVDFSFRTYATAIGGTLIVPNAGQLPANSPIGQTARTLSDLRRYVHNGTTWVTDGPYGQACGSIVVNVSSGPTGTVHVTFPTGRFSLAPKITGLTNLGGSLSGNYILRAYNVTSTGFDVDAIHKDNTSGSATVNVDWQATQMSATSAAG